MLSLTASEVTTLWRYTNIFIIIIIITGDYVLGWLRGTVVRTLVFDRRTFLSHARPAADG